MTIPDLKTALAEAQACLVQLDHPGANRKLDEALRAAPEGNPDLEMGRLLLAETSLVVGRWERAQRELERLVENATTPQVKLRALLGQGDLYSMRGEPEQARDALEKASHVTEGIEPHWRLMAALRLATLAGGTGENDFCRSLLQKVERDPELGPLAEVQAVLYGQQAMVAFRHSQRSEAEAFLDKAIAALRAGAVKSLEEAGITRYMGVMASLRRDHRQSMALHLRALAIYMQSGHRYGQAKVYDSIGRTLLAANRLDEAVFTFKKSESLCRRLGANAELATLYGKLGQVATMREDLEGAIRYFQKDLELSSRYRNYYALGYSYRNLGRCLMQVGRFDEAVTNLKESIGLFQYVEDWMNLARVYMDLGFAHVRAGQVDEAALVHDRAEALFAEHGLKWEAAFLKCLAGMIARSRGQVEVAETRFQECIDVLKGSSSGSWLAECYFEMGVLYRQAKRKADTVLAFKSAVRAARLAGLSRQVTRYLQELESLDEVELFHVWMDELPAGSGATAS